jgi:hypothetical protein
LGLCDAASVPLAELVLVHLGGNGKLSATRLCSLLASAGAADVAQRLYLVLLLSVDDALDDVERASGQALNGSLARLRPPQSYGTCVDNAAGCRLLLAVHRLGGVVRRDRAKHATTVEVSACGARGLCHASALLAEVAHKIGKSSKFGS